MPIALSNTLQRVERSLFHAIRLKLVEHGYLPEITDFSDDAVGIAAWKAALVAIRADKGFAVEVFGVGSNQKKYNLKVPRIVITEEQRLPGALGGDPQPRYNPVVDTNLLVGYERYTTPPQAKELNYDISLVYQTAEEGRLLNQILAISVPGRGYIDFYDDIGALSSPERIFVRHIGFSKQSFTEEGYVDSTYFYAIDDIWDIANNIDEALIAPLNEITIETYIGEQEPDDIILTPDITQVINEQSYPGI